MPSRLPLFHDVPAHSYSVVLDGVTYQIRMVYRERRRSWYVDIRDQDGDPIVLGRRLSPHWSPDKDVSVDGPAGLLVAIGPEPYGRHGVDLWYYTTEELAEFAVAEDDLAVTVDP